MKERAIGIFDSGIGGLELVNQLNQLLPEEKIIFYSRDIAVDDQQNEKEIITEYARTCVDFLLEKNVKMIISASGDVNTLYGPKFPDADVSYFGTFVPAAQAASGKTRNNRIGVTGITSVVKKGGFAKIVKNIRQGITVIGAACQRVHEITEDGIHIPETEMTESIRNDISVIIENKPDTVIIADGISHLYRSKFEEMLGSDTVIVTPFEETAKRIYNDLLEKDMLSERDEKPANDIYVSGSMNIFNRLSSMFLSRENNFISVSE